MSNLPPEILNDIFIQLELKQRLECLSVCRSWWRALDSYSLFYNFVIQKDDQLNKFLDAFERLPVYAAQVQELAIQGLVNANFSERSILNTFPNVRVVIVQRYLTSPDYTFLYIKKYNGVVHSKSKLEYLSDYNNCTMASQMLSLKLGDRLESLYLNLWNLQSTQTVLSQLKDLPVLKKLYFYEVHIKINDLENMHNNIPSIQDFSLISAAILAGGLPSDIVPATFIKNFKITARRYANAQTCAQMYQYISKKYTNLTKVEYCDVALDYYSASQRRYVYLNGILDFLKMIAPKQSKLFLHCLPDDVDAFEALDVGNSQIKDLHLFRCATKTMFQFLSQSKQSEYIESIYMLDSIVEVIHPLKSMAYLTSLYIEYEDIHDARVNLADCLAACPPTLKSLTIQNGVVSAAPFTQQLESIEYLHLSRVDINIPVGDIISTCLPNLAQLELNGTLLCDVRIVLNNPHFRWADFVIGDIDDDDKRYGFSFKCPNMTETQYYSSCLEKATQVDRGDLRGLRLLSVESVTEKKSEGGDYGISIS